MTVEGRKRIYVSHPISGYDDQNAALAEEIAQSVDLSGGVAVLPLDIDPEPHDGPCPASYVAQQGDQHSAACYIKADIIAMLGCDAIVVAPDWQSSVGCRGEVMTALLCGMPMFFYRRYDGRILDDAGRQIPMNYWTVNP